MDLWKSTSDYNNEIPIQCPKVYEYNPRDFQTNANSLLTYAADSGQGVTFALESVIYCHLARKESSQQKMGNIGRMVS